MNKNDMLKRSLLINFCVFISMIVNAQDTIRFAIPNDFGLVDYTNCKITNAKQLDSFFQKLYQLKKVNQGKVNIVHLGDSHIQGDYLTQQVRQNFQKEFGNGGRGFLTPNKVAQTNEGASYSSQSKQKWDAKRMVFTDQPLPIGLGGVTVSSNEDGASIKINIKNYLQLNYSFNKLTVFFLQDSKTYNIVIQDTLDQTLGYIGSFSESKVPNSATVNLPGSYNTIVFKSLKNLPTQEKATYFGFNFENNKPGVIYHSIGANGAKYKHYLAAKYFAEQTKSLNTDLFILALGTNEALDYPYTEPNLKDDVKTLVDKIKAINSNVQVIISIPPGSYRKKTKKNPGVINIRKLLLEVALELGIPVFDLYEAGGGNHFADHWKREKLLRDDGVHFTRAGYELQGDILYLALVKAYNQYVSTRYK